MTDKLFVTEIMPPDETVTDDQLLFLGKLFEGITKEQWLWEFRKSPAGAEVFWAKYQEQLAAHYAVISFPFQCGKQIFRGAKAEGSLSDPNIIRTLPKDSDRRVFLSLVRTALEHCSETGIDLIFGFPNKRALPTQVKGGYEVVDLPIVNAKCIFDIKIYLKGRKGLAASLVRFVSWLPNFATNIYASWRSHTSESIRAITEKDSEALEVFSQAFGELFPDILTPYRDWAYLSWRFLGNPYAPCELFGYFEGEKIMGIIALSNTLTDTKISSVIQDIVALESGGADTLLRYALKWALERKSCDLEVWAMNEGPSNKLINQQLRINGFWFCPKSIKKMIVASNKDGLSIKAKNWHISKGLQRS